MGAMNRVIDSDRRRGARGIGIPLQVVLLLAVPLAFLIAVLVLTLLVERATERTTVASSRATKLLSGSDTIFRATNESGVALTRYLKGHSPAALGAHEAGVADLQAQLGAFDALIPTEPAVAPAARRFETVARQIPALWKAYLADIGSGQKKKAAALAAKPSTQRLGSEWSAAKLALDAALRNRIIAEYTSLRRLLSTLTTVLLVASALGLALTLYVALRFGLRLVRRLHTLAENARQLAAGGVATPMDGNDEIALLDRAYRDAFAGYEREHAVATTLQRALLPQKFPSLAGVRIDTAYIPAAQDAEIGGDWYDVFELPHRRIGFSIGDVAGHGLQAAAVMGSVRQSIRNAARFESSASAVLSYANQMLCADAAVVVTAFFGTFDLNDGGVSYALAGHAPPIVIHPTGAIEPLQGNGLVLGFDPKTHYDDFAAKLDVGSGLVLFTDGVIETERDYFKGMRDLEDAIRAEYADPSSNIADGIQRRAMKALPPRDDAAVLFLGITNLGAEATANTQDWRFDSCDEVAARRIKRAVLWQFAGLASTTPEFAAIETILGELLSNVVRHSPGEAVVKLERRDCDFVLSVEDRGPPFAFNGATTHATLLDEGGRGLLLVRAFARDVAVERIAGGNRVSAVLPLPRTA
jgi:serine phosphatase RsbU (regulator of sigma subunit)/anti-sigma regulatory factor (Ser/Thr protein kinase)